MPLPQPELLTNVAEDGAWDVLGEPNANRTARAIAITAIRFLWISSRLLPIGPRTALP